MYSKENPICSRRGGSFSVLLRTLPSFFSVVSVVRQAMAAALIDTAMSSLPATSQQPRPPLRRATYVHVSDLTSAYNIDHALLEQELTRVKAERETTEPSKPSGIGIPDVDASSPGADFDTALVSAPQKRLPEYGFRR